MEGNWSQRMNRRLSPNRCLIRSWWRTVRAMDVFPIPPGPMRAIGVRSSARPMISSIRSSRPKQALGRGGGDSPGGFDVGVRCWIRQRLRSLTRLEPATYLTINNCIPNVIHELRHELGTLVASHITGVLEAIRYVSKLAFDSFQGTRTD